MASEIDFREVDDSEIEENYKCSVCGGSIDVVSKSKTSFEYTCAESDGCGTSGTHFSGE
jgi:hypothetical protein